MMPSEQRPVIAFFDIDNTLVRGATVYLVGLGAWRLRLLRVRDVAMFAWQQARFMSVGENMKHTESAKARTLEMLRGHTEAELRELAEDVYDRSIEARLWPEVVERARWHLDEGHEVWLISATAQIMADVICDRLGLTGALGTRFETTADDPAVSDDRAADARGRANDDSAADERGPTDNGSAADAHGVFTGRLDGVMLHGDEKAAGARRLADARGADLAEAYAYSDSLNDAPLLGAVGHPVAVNADSGQLKLAETEGWPQLPLTLQNSRAPRSKKRQAAKA